MTLNAETLLRFLDGDLTPEERETVERRMAQDAELRAELKGLESLRFRVRETAAALGEQSVPPYLSTRVLARLARRAEEAWWPETAARIAALFRPLVVAGSLLIMGVAAYNVASSDAYEAETTLAEEVLGLPPITVHTAFDLTY